MLLALLARTGLAQLDIVAADMCFTYSTNHSHSMIHYTH